MPLPPAPKRLGDKVQATPAPEEPSPAEASAAPAPAPSKAPQASTKAATKTPASTKTATKAATKPSAAPAAAQPTKATPVAKTTQGSKTTLPAKTTPATKSAPTAPGPRKLFVLDTNVLLHDPSSLFRFAEHDIFLPMIVLEELDQQKKGMSEVARNARQASRYLDELMAAKDISTGLELNSLGNIEALGRLFFQTDRLAASLPLDLPLGKADNAILNVVHGLRQAQPQRAVVLVSKDINMRLKARALKLAAEDYLNDHVLEDSDLLYDGFTVLENDFWSKNGKGMESWQQDGQTWYRLRGPAIKHLQLNQFVYLEDGKPFYAQVRELTGKTAVLATVLDYGHAKNAVWGINARNREQNFALNLLLDPNIDFVSLLGQAGTGKTLLTLAAGLAQVFDTRRYGEIIITRATVPVGEDIGFLPGSEEEKMLPWMGALEDNLEVLWRAMGQSSSSSSSGNAEWSRSTPMETIRAHIKVKSLNFMRGRTFLNKYLIIDEAQNLTPKQMKTLITRAGPGTKVICMGNIAQIDTPYLTEGSSGLTFVVDRFKGWPHAGHITLQRGERSRLADYASDAL